MPGPRCTSAASAGCPSSRRRVGATRTPPPTRGSCPNRPRPAPTRRSPSLHRRSPPRRPSAARRPTDLGGPGADARTVAAPARHTGHARVVRPVGPARRTCRRGRHRRPGARHGPAAPAVAAAPGAAWPTRHRPDGSAWPGSRCSRRGPAPLRSDAASDTDLDMGARLAERLAVISSGSTLPSTRAGWPSSRRPRPGTVRGSRRSMPTRRWSSAARPRAAG